MLDRDVYSLWHSCMIIIFIANGLYYAVGRRYVVVCCYRRDVIVQVGLVCVDGCGVVGRVSNGCSACYNYETRGSYNYEKLACSSRVVELPNAAEILPPVALEKRQRTEPDNTYT